MPGSPFGPVLFFHCTINLVQGEVYLIQHYVIKFNLLVDHRLSLYCGPKLYIKNWFLHDSMSMTSLEQNGYQILVKLCTINLVQGEVYLIQHYVIKFVGDL
jgi:hypothetical protein